MPALGGPELLGEDAVNVELVADHDKVREGDPLLLDDLLPHGDGRRLLEGLVQHSLVVTGLPVGAEEQLLHDFFQGKFVDEILILVLQHPEEEHDPFGLVLS